VESRKRATYRKSTHPGNIERKNSWTLAEQGGDLVPDCMLPVGTPGAIRDDLRSHGLEHLIPSSIVVVDETGFLPAWRVLDLMHPPTAER
jgi:hypothetical protein